ncbi:terpene synthase family protein (plasmid) [Streptomyces olivoreticuli]|uniref:terpene synthase family protein n=1 Tax=Streptomyces olivoreticuli TaxID=68246 RepID=UPI00265A0797|nr:terpene synthase family protein [Streptomyces olivoreticuli]WKK27816.1 terpene synthase family protein [Streptomyces olivoreticuli]
MNSTPSYESLLQDLKTHFPQLEVSVGFDRVEGLYRNTREFACRHGLPGSEDRENLGKTVMGAPLFLSTAYPEADQKDLQLTVDALMWFILFDEVHVERSYIEGVDALARQIFELLDVLGGGAVHRAPGFSTALAEILHRSDGWARCQQDGLQNALYGVLLGWQWEAQLRAARSQPSLRTYLDARLHVGGGVLVWACAEPLGGYVLPGIARQNPQLIRLRRAAANLVGWVNDLCSYVKEKKQEGDRSINLPNVLMHEKKCDLNDALTGTCELISHEAKVAAEMIQHLSESSLPEVRAYARDTHRMLRVQTEFYVKGGLGRYTDG